MYMAVMLSSHVIDINRSNDEIRPGDPGPMMGINSVCPHHLIGVDQSR